MLLLSALTRLSLPGVVREDWLRLGDWSEEAEGGRVFVAVVLVLGEVAVGGTRVSFPPAVDVAVACAGGGCSLLSIGEGVLGFVLLAVGLGEVVRDMLWEVDGCLDVNAAARELAMMEGRRVGRSGGGLEPRSLRKERRRTKGL